MKSFHLAEFFSFDIAPYCSTAKFESGQSILEEGSGSYLGRSSDLCPRYDRLRVCQPILPVRGQGQIVSHSREWTNFFGQLP